MEVVGGGEGIFVVGMCGVLVGLVCLIVMNCNIIFRGNVFNCYFDCYMRSVWI